MCMLGCPESRFQRCCFRLLCCVVSCQYGMWGLCFAVPSHVHPATPVPLLNALLCSSSQCNTQGILLTLLTARSLPRRMEAPPTAVMRTRRPSTGGMERPLLPLKVVMYHRLGEPLMVLITAVGASATHHSNGTFTLGQFVTGMPSELSVCLCRQNANIEQAVIVCFVWLSGGSYSPGLVQLTAEGR
jgi:hypothetical protein